MKKELELSVENSAFYSKIFSIIARAMKKVPAANPKDEVCNAATDEYIELSKRMDRSKIQESIAARNVLRTRRLANLLIDDSGELQFQLIAPLIEFLEKNLYSLGPDRQFDALRQKQILSVLKELQNNPEAVRALKKFSKPFSNKLADQIIRETLQLPSHSVITDAHTRRAVLSAWLCYLRQNIGSCFATAPAIIVHDEQPLVLLKDLDELISTGRLKRVFGGKEYSVPLSKSWGIGDLKKPIFIEKRGDSFIPEIWFSPGLLRALEEIEWFGKDLKEREKILSFKKWVRKFFEKRLKNQFFLFITPEELMRALVLENAGITEKDLKDFENRPRPMFQTASLIQIPKNFAGSGGLGEAVEKFHLKFQQAKIAFLALTDNALLKAWEFTLASFAETKAQFTRWNLYASLGLGPNETGGIGECLYAAIKEKLDRENAKVQEHQLEYEQAYSQVKYIESKMAHVSSEKEAQWLKMEYQTKIHDFYFIQDLRDSSHKRAKFFANLFNRLIDEYDILFQDYFQEVYDVDMQEVITGPYDDSPAGFRLLYKHGRANTSQWTLIYTPNEFINALSSFFIATESQILGSIGSTELEQDITELITRVVNHVKTTQFLESAFYRMAKAHETPIIKDPLNNLEKIEKKPWAYTSGGAMSTLVSCYFRREDRPTEVSKWVENDTELLVFFVDALKQTSPGLQQSIESGEIKSFLMHSPTHAFQLKPSFQKFKTLWKNDAYTYIWLRDSSIIPSQRFVESIVLDDERIEFLLEEILNNIPIELHVYFKKGFSKHHLSMSPMDFRAQALEVIEYNRYLQSGILTIDEVDHLLYTALPLFSYDQLETVLEEIFKELPLSEDFRKECMDQFKNTRIIPGKFRLITSRRVQEICKALILNQLNTTNASQDFHLLVSQAVQKLGYAMPSPIFVADTNWIKDLFGFVVNPGTGRFELWRVDYTGTIGYPLSSWRQWLNGSRQSPQWGIYIKPFEYRY